jgi:hypothetical protein
MTIAFLKFAGIVNPRKIFGVLWVAREWCQCLTFCRIKLNDNIVQDKILFGRHHIGLGTVFGPIWQGVQGGDKAGHRIVGVVLTRAVQNPSTDRLLALGAAGAVCCGN